MRRCASISLNIDMLNHKLRLLVAVAGAVLPAYAWAVAADVDGRLTEAATAIEQVLNQSPLPGIVIGVTDRKALRKVIVHGYADLKTHQPMTADSRFAIGSISKSFTAIALMQLAEEKRFDPHTPVSRYLPSLVLHSRFAPIAGHDLLSHTSGLPNYLPDSASSRFAAVELRDFTPSYAPGTHFWYSNTGYQLLGYVLENIEHSSYTQILRRRVLDPLNMTATSAVIDDAQRTRMVVSYVHWPYDGSYVEAPWFEYSAADGSLVANVSDMSSYVRFFLNKGAGDKGRVLSEKSFATLTTPVLEDYAYGLRVRQEEGHTVIGHSGSIGGFHAHIEAHVDEGFGLVFLCNAAIDPPLQPWIVGTVRAAYEGKAPPPPPPSSPPSSLSDYAGQFRLRTGTDKLTFVTSGDRLFLMGAHGNIPLERMGKDLFRAAGDAAGVFPFAFGRTGDEGKITDVSQGALWYAADGFAEPIQPAAPQEYASYVGHYVNDGPEGPVARVFVRNGKLMMLLSEDEEAKALPLEPLEAGVFRIGPDPSPERAHFDTLVEGQALRLFVTGVPLYRKDIP